MKRNEHSLKKKLFSATDTSEKKKCKVHNVQAEEVAVAKVKENHEKRQTLTDLRQANKQLNQRSKKTQCELKSLKRTESKQARKAGINMADVGHLAELLKQTSGKLDGKLQEEKGGEAFQKQV